MPTGVYERKSFSKETRNKMSQRKIGNKYALGKKQSIEHIEKRVSQFRGSKHPKWKGGVCQNKEYVNWRKNKRNRLRGALNLGGSFHTFGEWELLKKQYGYMCPCCKKGEPEIKLTEDHIIPLSKGGSDDIENIQPLCLHCNMSKHTKIIKY